MKKDNLITFSIQPYDFYSCFYDSIVGLELAQRRLSHTFYASFGYVAALPPELERRDLVASELDRKGKVTREVRAWNNGLIEVRITRSPATRRCIDVWGYFYSKVEAAECLNELGKHLPKENGARRDDSVTVTFWNVGMTHGERQPRRQSQTMQVPKWNEIASNYPGRVRSALATAMKLQESDVSASGMMLWRGLPGTGKTWAIRSLMREWSTWCTFIMSWIQQRSFLTVTSCCPFSRWPASRVGLKKKLAANGALSFLKMPASSSRWTHAINMDRR